MENKEIADLFKKLSTPLLADACLRVKISLRLAPPGISPILKEHRIAGRVIPVAHYGSVDIFLEAMGVAEPGDILVIDNNGRMDEACIGDLIALEAQSTGLAGILVWGLHRDSEELKKIGFPVFSYGSCPAGPRRSDQPASGTYQSVMFGDSVVERDDMVFGDMDGVLFIPGYCVEKVFQAAESIREIEHKQSDAIRRGITLREQLKFNEYLKKREIESDYTFRKHLKVMKGAIEE